MLSSESDRLERLEAIQELWKDHLKDRFAPGTHGYHEAVDRAMMCYEIVEFYLLGHPAVVQDEEVFDKVHKASELLMSAYQDLALKHDGPQS